MPSRRRSNAAPEDDGDSGSEYSTSNVSESVEPAPPPREAHVLPDADNPSGKVLVELGIEMRATETATDDEVTLHALVHDMKGSLLAHVDAKHGYGDGAVSVIQDDLSDREQIVFDLNKLPIDVDSVSLVMWAPHADETYEGDDEEEEEGGDQTTGSAYSDADSADGDADEDKDGEEDGAGVGEAAEPVVKPKKGRAVYCTILNHEDGSPIQKFSQQIFRGNLGSCVARVQRTPDGLQWDFGMEYHHITDDEEDDVFLAAEAVTDWVIEQNAARPPRCVGLEKKEDVYTLPEDPAVFAVRVRYTEKDPVPTANEIAAQKAAEAAAAAAAKAEADAAAGIGKEDSDAEDDKDKAKKSKDKGKDKGKGKDKRRRADSESEEEPDEEPEFDDDVAEGEGEEEEEVPAGPPPVRLCVVLTDHKGRVVETTLGGDPERSVTEDGAVSHVGRRRVKGDEHVTEVDDVVNFSFADMSENVVAATIVLFDTAGLHANTADYVVRVMDASNVEEQHYSMSEGGSVVDDDSYDVSADVSESGAQEGATDGDEGEAERAARLLREEGVPLAKFESKATNVLQAGEPTDAPTGQVLLRLERRKDAEGRWTVQPVGNCVTGESVEVVAKKVEKDIQMILPRFSIDLEVGTPVVLEDPKEAWPYTSITVGFGWDLEDVPEDMGVFGAAVLFDQRGTELATVDHARSNVYDGVAVWEEVLPFDEYAEEEGDSQEVSDEEMDLDSQSDSGEQEEAVVAVVDTDLQKLRLKLSDLPDEVRSVFFILGLYSEEFLPETDTMYMRVLDTTNAEQPREAARLPIPPEIERTAVVTGKLERSPDGTRWVLSPLTDFYEHEGGVRSVILDVEAAYRETVPVELLTIPETVQATNPRELLPLPTGTFERTLAIIKPSAVRSDSVGPILEAIQLHGFIVLARRQVQLNRSQAGTFYKEHVGREFFERLVTHMTSGPIVVLTLGRSAAVSAWRALMGASDETEGHPLTLRYRFAEDATANAVHGSDSVENAKREIKFFFPDMILEPLPTGEEAIEFLEDNTNETLLKGLTALCKHKPAEPIKWLAYWLMENNPNRPVVEVPDSARNSATYVVA